MFNSSRSWAIVLAGCLGILCTACQPNTPEKPAPRKPPAEPVVDREATEAVEDREASETPQPPPVAKAEPKTDEMKAAAPKPTPQEALVPLAIPKVAMSEELRAACLVNVGDTMPGAELPDPAGKMHALDSLYGQKLTVVCLWTDATHPSQLVAMEILQDLMKEVAGPFADKGVAVIGINVGGAPTAVAQELSQAGVTLPNLLDPKREFFAKIAKDKRMPRTFLLDAAGRILWLDIGHSRASRQELLQSIRVALGEL